MDNGRLDFRARIREGSITLVGGNKRIVDAMAEAIPLYTGSTMILII